MDPGFLPRKKGQQKFWNPAHWKEGFFAKRKRVKRIPLSLPKEMSLSKEPTKTNDYLCIHLVRNQP